MIKKVIFILTDTVRTQNIGLYGRNPSPTPHIDALGKESVVFTNAYTTITKTDPAIAAIMTGKYPLSLGLVNHAANISSEEKNNISTATFLPEILKQNGYRTAAVDWMLRWHKKGYTYYSGKIAQDVDIRKPLFARIAFPRILRAIDRVTAKFLGRIFFNRFYFAIFPNPKIPYDSADIVVNKAIKILSKNKTDKLFLYLHFWDAHFPHVRPRGLRSYFLDTIKNTYEAEITFLDSQIGILFNYLKKHHSLEDTCIILTSDHGESVNEHNLSLVHQHLYEEVVKIPLIIKHPSLRSKQVNALVQHIDLLPSLLDLLKIPYAREEFDGKSFLPVISGEKKKIRNFVYFEDMPFKKYRSFIRNIRRRGMRRNNYKFIESTTGKDGEVYKIFPSNIQIVKKELYNLKSDPREQKNLIVQNSKLAIAMQNQLYDFINYLAHKRITKKKTV